MEDSIRLGLSASILRRNSLVLAMQTGYLTSNLMGSLVDEPISLRLYASISEHCKIILLDKVSRSLMREMMRLGEVSYILVKVVACGQDPA